MMDILTSEQRYLSRREASAHLTSLGLPVAVRTLAKFAVYGGGPAFVRFGRAVRYPREALEVWIKDRVGPLRRSTSDTVSLPGK